MTNEIHAPRPGPGPDVVWQDVKGNLVAVCLDSGKYYTFNEVGRLIWLGLDAGKDRKEIVADICHRFDVDPTDAENDFEHFVESLAGKGFIEKPSPSTKGEQ